MIFKFFRGAASEPLEQMQSRVRDMLALDRHEFDLAMSALLGDVPAADVNREVRATDQKVNRLEREIRRVLVVHSSVFGGIDSPSVLVYMSVVKDIERVGDYAKNLLDLALEGANLGSGADADEWRRTAAEVSEFITAAGDVFSAADADRGRELRSRGDAFLRRYDERVSALVRGDDQAPQGVPRALAYRYLKRVVAHLMNLLSAITMPIDQLDYFDEDPEDRLTP